MSGRCPPLPPTAGRCGLSAGSPARRPHRRPRGRHHDLSRPRGCGLAGWARHGPGHHGAYLAGAGDEAGLPVPGLLGHDEAGAAPLPHDLAAPPPRQLRRHLPDRPAPARSSAPRPRHLGRGGSHLGLQTRHEHLAAGSRELLELGRCK